MSTYIQFHPHTVSRLHLPHSHFIVFFPTNPTFLWYNINSRTSPAWIILPFERLRLKKVFIQVGSRSCCNLRNTIRNTQKTIKYSGISLWN